MSMEDLFEEMIRQTSYDEMIDFLNTEAQGHFAAFISLSSISSWPKASGHST